MIRGLGNAVIAILVASVLDKYFNGGHYTDATLAMLRQIEHSFGF